MLAQVISNRLGQLLFGTGIVAAVLLVILAQKHENFLVAGTQDEELKKAAFERKESINSLVKNLSAIEAEAVLSRLTYGQMKHLSFKDLKARGESLKPGVDRVIELDNLPEPLKELERIVGSGREFLPAHFLVIGAQRQAGVGRIRLKKSHNGLPAGNGWGTGFLVSPSIIMTNNHVIDSKEFAKTKVKVQFNFQNDLEGNQMPIDEYDFDSDSLFYTSATLDITLVRVKPNPQFGSGNPNQPLILPGQNWGIIPIDPEIEFAIGQQVNVIQHPDGRHKEVVLHENQITDVFDNFLHYKADTEPGSSGSPVFNNMWKLVALHHAGGIQAVNGEWLSNEGVRIDKIIADIKTNANAVVSELGL